MNAWQWDALFWVPLAGLLMLVTAAFLLVRSSRSAALVALTAAALAFIGYAVLNAPLTSDY
jgi:predicted membrane protein